MGHFSTQGSFYQQMHHCPASAWDYVLLSRLIHKTRGLYQSQVDSDVNLQGWNPLGQSVHILGARCSHCRVIIILWLFGKTGMASGTFSYIHEKTRKYVYWHSEMKTKQNKKTYLQLDKKTKRQKNCSISQTEYFSDANGLCLIWATDTWSNAWPFLFSVSEA